MNLKKDSNIANIETTDGKNIKEEKRKKLAEKYQLDEDTINEMASIAQTIKGLKALGDEKNAELVSKVAQKTLNQFKEDPDTSSGRLARNLKPDEYPNRKPNKDGKRQITYSTEFLKNFKEETGKDFDKLTYDIEARWEEEKPGEKKPFKSPGLAANTTDKDAANQLTGKEAGQRGRKADPNKPEKAPSTGQRGRKPGTKVATRTTGDDGFDTVTYSTSEKDSEEDKAAAAAAKVDKALGGKYAQELSSEDEAKYKEYKNDIDGLVKDLEDKFDKSKMAELRLYLEDSEVRKLFKAKGVKLSDLVRSVIK
jgi:hypothetical protein